MPCDTILPPTGIYPYQIISTDVPGHGGYSASPFTGAEPEEGLREYGSYFCRFTGTSAACAIIGGFLALARGLGKYDPCADGVGLKAWLVRQSSPPLTGQPNVFVPCLDGNGLRISEDGRYHLAMPA